MYPIIVLVSVAFGTTQPAKSIRSVMAAQGSGAIVWTPHSHDPAMGHGVDPVSQVVTSTTTLYQIEAWVEDKDTYVRTTPPQELAERAGEENDVVIEVRPVGGGWTTLSTAFSPSSGRRTNTYVWTGLMPGLVATGKVHTVIYEYKGVDTKVLTSAWDADTNISSSTTNYHYIPNVQGPVGD